MGLVPSEKETQEKISLCHMRIPREGDLSTSQKACPHLTIDLLDLLSWTYQPPEL